MKIHLYRFMCYNNTTYELPDDGVIRLRGKNGSGKTTLLLSIMWCLYGYPRNVSYMGSQKKCSVTIQYNSVEIYRQKRPNYLSITIDEKYESSVAQEMINKRFGKSGFWETCSYIPQKFRCKLLSGNQSERMEVLNKLAFDDDDPEYWIGKLENKVKESRVIYDEHARQFNDKCLVFRKQLENSDVSIKESINQTRCSEIHDEINQLKVEKEQLQEKRLEYQHQLGYKKSLQSQLEQVETSISSIPVYTQDEVSEMESQLEHKKRLLPIVSEYRNLQQRISEYRKQIDSLEPQIKEYINPVIPTVSNEDVWRARESEKQHNKYSEIANSINVEYSEESIRDKITELQEQLQKVYKAEVESKHQQLRMTIETQLNEVDNNIDTVQQQLEQLKHPNQYNIQQLKEQWEQAKYTRIQYQEYNQQLQCPNCNIGLIYTNGTLSVGDKPVISDESLNEAKMDEQRLKDELDRAYKYQLLVEKLEKYQEDRKRIVTQLEQIPKQDVEQLSTDSKELERTIQELHKIIIVDLPETPSDILERLVRYRELSNQLENDRNQLDHILSENQWSHIQDIEYNQLETEVTRLDREVKQAKQHIQTLEQLQERRNKIQSEIQSIHLDEQVEIRYQEVVETIENRETMLDRGKRANELLEQHNQLKQNKQTLEQEHQTLTAVEKLKGTAVSVECYLLEQIVESINIQMNEILGELFDEPVVVELSLYRQLKSEKRTKPQVNIKIVFNGMEYDRVEMISGGEGDKVSLALIIALNQLSGSPWLLLDECFGSMDFEIRMEAVDVIKRFCEGKLVLIANHADVEGVYDQVVDINR